MILNIDSGGLRAKKVVFTFSVADFCAFAFAFASAQMALVFSIQERALLHKIKIIQ